MKEEDENKKKKSEEEKKKLNQLNNFPGENLKKPELTPEQLEERLLTSGRLFEETERLTEQEQRRKRKRDKEIFESRIIELGDGRKFTVKELQSLVIGEREAYVALFPNDSPFFSEVFRLNGIKQDPKQYSKPYIVSQIVRRIIYDRFESEVLPALDHLNPITVGGFRQYKLSQYLNKEGKDKVIRFREEAIELMKEYPDLEWYQFEKEYSKRHKLVFQPSLFEMMD